MKAPKKLLLATALAAVFPAHAASVVEMYGTVMPFFENGKTSGATSPAPADRPAQVPAAAFTGADDPSRWRMTVGTTAWGFRGYEDLSPNLRAVWQLESGFQIDQNTGPGLGARNSKIGLAGSWGEVNLGQWDTPYKFISLQINPFRAGYSFDYTPIMGNPGMGVPVTTTQFTRIGAKPDAAFDKRVGNFVQYWSPRWGGLSFRVGHGVNEGRGTVVAGGPIVSPTITSANVIWDIGSFSVRYGYEQHNDYFGMSQLGGAAAGTANNSSSRDRANKIVLMWRAGGTRVAAAFEQLEYHNHEANLAATANDVNKYKRRAFYVIGEQTFGRNAVFISYSRADEGDCSRVGGGACSTANLGADYMTIGWIYRFSKRTEVFATYYKIKTDSASQYTVQPVIGNSPMAPGADTTGAGVGMIHYF
jgi:predicted porin